ncbi:hypothetical protein CK556_03275 [Mesoplasma chauliocola]|uniref:Septation ring formation regulator EzrA n=1 Tax=Mesoplasma chauliocola TaxID=216427 RepID=A0A249SPE7_9MOLU|nr:hypothetical protein [Mesoplasma chauliocola]ASZ09351.1 hypothetical protein CK556_03275 [Mesoplasma chauliocola]
MILFSTLVNKPTTLLILGLIFVVISILGIIGTLITLVIYKKTIEYTYESSRLLEYVDHAPLLKKIRSVYRIYMQNKTNRNIESTFLILLRNYYDIYATRFSNLTTEAAEMLSENNYRPKPSISNYIKAKRTYDKCSCLYVDTRNTIDNIENILEMQKIARDWYINVIEETNNVLTLIKTRKDSNDIWGPKTLNSKYIQNLKLYIESANLQIESAKYNEAVSSLKEAYEIIANLIQIIDHTEKMLYLTDYQLTSKMEEIRVSILQNWGRNELEKTNKSSQFSSLFNVYSNMIKNIKSNIYSLNFEKAYETSKSILDQIKDFEKNMRYEMLIIGFVETSKININNAFSGLSNEVILIKDTMSLNEGFGFAKNINLIKSKMLNVEHTIKDIQTKYNSLLIEFDLRKTSVQKLNYAKQGSLLMDIFSKIFMSFENLRVIRSELTTKENIINEIDSRNISFKKILSIMEVMIVKNSEISILKTYEKQINEGFNKLNRAEKELKQEPEIFYNRENYNLMINFLDSEIINFAMLRNEMASAIYLAKLAEMSLSYLNRFGGIKSIDDQIALCLAEFEAENYEDCLRDNILILNKLTSQNVSVS